MPKQERNDSGDMDDCAPQYASDIVPIPTFLLTSLAEGLSRVDSRQVWEDLQCARQDLASSRSELQDLRRKLSMAHHRYLKAEQRADALSSEVLQLRSALQTARKAVDRSQTQLSALWRVITSRSGRAQRFVPLVRNRRRRTPGSSRVVPKAGWTNLWSLSQRRRTWSGW